MVVGVGAITRQISHHQRYLHSTSCFSLRPQFVRNNCRLLQSIILSQPSLSAQSQYSLLHFSPKIISQLVVEPRVAEVAQCKEYQVCQWQWAVLSVQPPEMWGRPDRIIIFIRVVFVDGNHPAIYNYQVFLLNKKKVQ